MIKRRWILLMGITALLLPRCSDDDLGNGALPDPETENGDIAFEIGFAPNAGMDNAGANGTSPTRVATGADFKSEWEEGDEIGVFAVEHDTPLSFPSENYIHNAKLVYSSTGGGSWTQETPLYWPASASDITALDFYAYYPYNDTIDDPTAVAFFVKTNQSDSTTINGTYKSNYSLSDLLTAKGDNSGNGYDKTTSTVPLTFSHAMAMVQVQVPSEGKGFGPGESLRVTLRGVKPGATVNFNEVDTGTPGSGISLAETDNPATSITMYRVEQHGDADFETSFTYRALVPAQTVTEGNSLFWFEHEERTLLQDEALTTGFAMAAGKAETFVRTLPSTLLHTVLVPAGRFLMGSSDGSNTATGTPGIDPNATPAEPDRQSNETQHRVTLSKDFYMTKYEITNTQYAVFLNDAGIVLNGQNGNGIVDNVERTLILISNFGITYDNGAWRAQSGYENHPVVYVTWYGAKAYADWISGSLPTEAQWEYACRGGVENSPFSIGTGYEMNSSLANFNWYSSWRWDGRSTDASITNTSSNPPTVQAVGSYPYPNSYGLYDMHGNAWEWCADWYTANYGNADAIDPSGPDIGTKRVKRGGAYYDEAKYCRSAYRKNEKPSMSYDLSTFRVVFVQ